MAAEGIAGSVWHWLNGVGRQWGRGRMAAEGGGAGQPLDLVQRVNGAAAGWPRKAELERRGRMWGYSRQWGRGRMAAEGRLKSVPSP